MRRLSNSALELSGRAEIRRGGAEGPHAARPAGQRERVRRTGEMNDRWH